MNLENRIREYFGNIFLDFRAQLRFFDRSRYVSRFSSVELSLRTAALALTFTGFSLISVYSVAAQAQTARLKDLANIKGVRSNQLIGYGLVIGLPKTGDSAASLSTNRAVSNMLMRMGITSNSADIVGGSAAAIIATVDLPAFSRGGEKVDIRISAVGDATSLAGGTLLLTPMRAGDGKIYVIGQGAVVVGQASGSGTSVLTVATVPGGGTVEREFVPVLARDGYLDLSLKTPDFTTNSRISEEINRTFKGFYAESLDPAVVRVEVPLIYQGKLVEFIGRLELLKVLVDRKAIVVINERTGTVVMGSQVMVGPVSIAHGNLSITVGSDEDDYQRKRLMKIKGTTVGDLIKSLNDLGVRPKDLIGILQAMHAAGALQAELKFM